MNFASPIFFTGMVLAAGMAHPQSGMNLGNVLDQSGKKLSSDEVKATLSGASTSYPSGSGTITEAFRNDGSIQARYEGMSGHASGGGTWKMEDGGKYCITATWNTIHAINPISGCFHIFKVGDKFFIANSETDRNAAAFERVYEK